MTFFVCQPDFRGQTTAATSVATRRALRITARRALATSGVRACQSARRVVFTAATRMLNELAGAEIHGQLERALRRYRRADFLVIDDFAVLAMDPGQANLAFQVISERYEYRRSTCITTNRLFKDWPKVFPDALNAQVMPSASPSAPSASSSTEGVSTDEELELITRVSTERPARPRTASPMRGRARARARSAAARPRRRTVPPPPGGSLGTGDAGGTGTHAGRWRHPWRLARG